MMNTDRFFSVFKTAGQGLSLQRRNISVASENIANANTTRGADGINPYKPKRVLASVSGQQQFGLALQDSVMQMRTSGSMHRANPSTDITTSGGTRDLGPQAETVEQEKYRFEYDPDHPDADENGMVKYPDVDMVEEMTHMVSANRLYEANLSVIEAEKMIVKRSLEI
jgi:flagellar basal-body rod protein FlgC